MGDVIRKFQVTERIRFMYRTFLVIVIAGFLLASGASAEVKWPQFRGASAGVVEDSILPSTWSATENVAWTLEIPGRVWSSPIVWGDRVFITSAVGGAGAEKPKKGLYFGGNRDKSSGKTHRWMVYCIDFNSGKILASSKLDEMCMATPAAVRGSLIIRTISKLYRIRRPL